MSDTLEFNKLVDSAYDAFYNGSSEQLRAIFLRIKTLYAESVLARCDESKQATAGTLNRDAIQQKALDCGFQYWRASDAHGVIATSAQAVDLLQDLLGVEVEIKEQAPAVEAGARDERAALTKQRIAELVAEFYEAGDGDTEHAYLDVDGLTEALYRAALARASEAKQPTEPGASIYVECCECVECGHIGINDSHDTDAACGYPCGWTGPSPIEDKCPGCQRENVMGAACPKCSGRYSILAEAILPAAKLVSVSASEAATTDSTRERIAQALHYPACWDTAAYPTLESAVWESIACAKLGCSECGGASEAAAGEPVAYVPVHPRTAPLWANTVPTLDSDRPAHYPVRALCYAAPQPATVPAGWKLVPVEPTDAMRKAGLAHTGAVSATYRDMVAAAPQPASEPVEEGCTPADAKMLRAANHGLADENAMLRRRLRPFALLATPRLSWAMFEYCIDGDPEKQTLQAPQMQRAFNRAAEALADELPSHEPADRDALDVPDWVKNAKPPAPEQPASEQQGDDFIGILTVKRFRGADSMVNTDFEYLGNLPDGSYRCYLHPAEQQAASVAPSKRERLIKKVLKLLNEHGFVDPRDGYARVRGRGFAKNLVDTLAAKGDGQ